MFGVASIIISYLLIIAALFWNYSNRIDWQRYYYLCLILVPISIWYSVILFFSFDSLLGYPTNTTMPNDTIIYSYRIVEPLNDNEGGMYFWGLPTEKITDKTFVPRSYRMDYDRELHTQLMKQVGSNGGVLRWRLSDLLKGKKGLKSLLRGRNNLSENQGKFELINPRDVLKKEIIEPSIEKECDGFCE